MRNMMINIMLVLHPEKAVFHRVGVADDPDSQLLEGTARPLRL